MNPHLGSHQSLQRRRLYMRVWSSFCTLYMGACPPAWQFIMISWALSDNLQAAKLIGYCPIMQATVLRPIKLNATAAGVPLKLIFAWLRTWPPRNFCLIEDLAASKLLILVTIDYPLDLSSAAAGKCQSGFSLVHSGNYFNPSDQSCSNNLDGSYFNPWVLLLIT